jgi:hypothetical protein
MYNFFFLENRVAYKIMWKNLVEPDGPIDGIIIRRVRFGGWITKATNTHSECVTPIAFPLQQ